MRRRRGMRRVVCCRAISLAAAVVGASASAALGQMFTRTENFNVDPNWDGRNNRATEPPPQLVTQNFGYKSSANAGGTLGEVGGLITPVGESAYYGKALIPLSFNSTLTMSGSLKLDGGGNVELGFFNNTTVNEWRTPNTVAFRLYGRGSYFLAYAEYGTSKWRAGAVEFPTQFNTASIHNFSLTYNPTGNGGSGQITANISGTPLTVNLDPGHKSDGASFNRWGFLNISKSWDGAGQFWVDNATVNGVNHKFDNDPGWTAHNNDTTYLTTNVRPRFDFGYSATNHAGGAGSGEMGGQIFRGDSRPEFDGKRMAYYGDVLDQTLDLNRPLMASGKLSFDRGVSDATTLIGFFHDDFSNQDDSLGRGRDFLGAVIEGPSSEGHFFYPGYITDSPGVGAASRGNNLPYIYPNGVNHNWVLNYDPAANNGNGRIYLSLDGHEGYVNLQPGHKAIGAYFNRFGIITTHIDGNGQTVWLDDLTYTVGFGDAAQWAANESGDWHNGLNWTAAIPNAVGAKAVFANNSAGRTVYANTGTTVGTLTFNSPNTWLLTGLGSLTMQVSSGSAHVNVEQGTHKINLPLIIASNTELNVASGATLKISDPVTINTGSSLTQTGAGTVTYEALVTLAGGSSMALAGSSQLGGGLALAPSARADVTGSMVVTDGDYQALASQVKRGFNGGDWRGEGISSSAAASDPHRASGLGVVDNAALGLTDFAGIIGLTGDEILVKHTWYGDVDLSGTVDLADFERFLIGYQRDDGGGTSWLDGDFDFSGDVDVADFDRYLLGLKYQPPRGVDGELFVALRTFAASEGLNVDLSAVPEPAAPGLLMIGAHRLMLGRRRQR